MKIFFLVVFCVLFVNGAAAAQDDVIRVDVDLVSVPLKFEKSGAPYLPSKSDLKIYDQGIEVADFNLDSQAPLTDFNLVIDEALIREPNLISQYIKLNQDLLKYGVYTGLFVSKINCPWVNGIVGQNIKSFQEQVINLKNCDQMYHTQMLSADINSAISASKAFISGGNVAFPEFKKRNPVGRNIIIAVSARPQVDETADFIKDDLYSYLQSSKSTFYSVWVGHKRNSKIERLAFGSSGGIRTINSPSEFSDTISQIIEDSTKTIWISWRPLSNTRGPHNFRITMPSGVKTRSRLVYER